MTHNVEFEYAEIYQNTIDEIFKTNYKRFSLYGGRNAAKSASVYRLAIDICLNDGSVMVVRRYKSTIVGSSYNDLVSIIYESGLEEYFKCTESPIRIRCLLNNNVISFAGLDDYNKLKSSKGKKSKYKLMIVEEAQEIKNQLDVEQAISSFNRGIGSEDFKIIYVFNPPESKEAWVNKELRETKDDLLALKVNYTDIPAEWVGDEINTIKRIKKSNINLYKWMYLGEPISVQSNVFENIEIRNITDKQIEKWEYDDDYIFNGLDFGWEDPNCGISCHYDMNEKTLYIYREFYKNHIHEDRLSEGLERAGFSKESRITADSANPDKIDILRRAYNWNIKAVEKDRVATGFYWLMSRSKIVIDANRCPNTAREFKEYHYELNKDGAIDEEKLFKWSGQADHGIAACRYACNKLIRSNRNI